MLFILWTPTFPCMLSNKIFVMHLTDTHNPVAFLLYIIYLYWNMYAPWNKQDFSFWKQVWCWLRSVYNCVIHDDDVNEMLGCYMHKWRNVHLIVIHIVKNEMDISRKSCNWTLFLGVPDVRSACLAGTLRRMASCSVSRITGHCMGTPVTDAGWSLQGQSW